MISEWLRKLSGRKGCEADEKHQSEVENLQRQVDELTREIAEHKTNDELNHLASFPEQYPNPIIEITSSGQIRYLNPAAREFFPDIITQGTAHETLQGLDSVASDLERDDLKSFSREVVVASRIFRETIHYLDELKLLRIYLKDITEQRKAEKTLKETERRLAAISENMLDMVVMTDLLGVYQYVTPSCKKITGFAPEEMIGKPAFAFIHPEDLLRMAEAIQEHLKTGASGRIELRARNSAGCYVWVEAVGDFIRDEDGKLTGVVLSGRNINDRKIAEEQLKKLLLEKEMLLKEVHHRTKNNMQVISSLLNLQSAYIKDERYLKIFKDSQNRIKSMSLVHEKLYRSSSGSVIDFGEYIRTLVNNLYYSYSVSPNQVSLKVNVEAVSFDTDTAITCGLMINEMISNSLKHAFPGGAKGNMWVEMRPDGEDYLLITGDDGTGLPEGMDLNKTGTLGMQLISSLVSQLNGTMEINREKGTQYRVRFKVKTG